MLNKEGLAFYKKRDVEFEKKFGIELITTDTPLPDVEGTSFLKSVKGDASLLTEKEIAWLDDYETEYL